MSEEQTAMRGFVGTFQASLFLLRESIGSSSIEYVIFSNGKQKLSQLDIFVPGQGRGDIRVEALTGL